MIIPMSKKHIELIKQGKKTSTLRSIKDDYPSGINKLPDGTLIHIYKPKEVYISPYSLIIYHSYRFETIIGDVRLNQIAHKEGYDSWADLIIALKKMRHKLPKYMLLYKFKLVKQC